MSRFYSDKDDCKKCEIAGDTELNLFTIFAINNKNNNTNARLKYFRKRKLHSNELELFQDVKNHKEWFRIKTLLESKKNMDIKFKDERDINNNNDKSDYINGINDDDHKIRDCQTFLSLLNQRFYYQKWKVILPNTNKNTNKHENESKNLNSNTINLPKSDICSCCGYEKYGSDGFGNWFLPGGSVLYCIMKNAREETGIKDLDFFAVHMYEGQFWEKIFKIAKYFQSSGYDAFFANNMKSTYSKLIVIDLYVNFSDKKSRIDKNSLPQYDKSCMYYGRRYCNHEFVGGRANGEIVEKYESDI